MSSVFGKKSDLSGFGDRRAERHVKGTTPASLFGNPRSINCYTCGAEIYEARAVAKPLGAKPGQTRTLHCTHKCASLPEPPEGEEATEGEPWQEG